MKFTNRILLLLVMVTAILISSCKKESTTESTGLGANSTGTFTATIGGTDWHATKVKAYVQDVFTRFGGEGSISDTSCKFSYVSIAFIVKYVKSPVTLDIGTDLPAKGYYFDATATMDCKLRKDGSTVSYVAKYVLTENNFSTLKLTTYSSEKLSGTVEFRSTCTAPVDTVDLRDGTFDITF